MQSVESSNRIEGIVTTKARIRSLVADKTMPRNRDEEEIMGYRDVLNTVHENYEYIDLTRHIVLQLHRDLYAYSHKGIGGQYKNVQNLIIERLADGSEVERFKPLAPYETPAAIDDFCHSINAVLQDKSVNPLLVIPVFIHDFLCIHPFNDGNGRMSRLLTTLLLYQNGYMIGKFISLEQKIERTKDSYYAALAQSGAGWHTGDEDVVPFVKYILRVILAAYRDFESRIALLTMSLSAKDRIKIIISATIGKITKSGILEKQPDIAVSTVEKALKELVEEGFIERHGVGRSTFYVKYRKKLAFTQNTFNIWYNKLNLILYEVKYMKKLLGTCLAAAAICAFGFGSASAVNWQVFGQDSAGITWSIDQDSVQKSDKTATVMIKAQDSEGYHFIATEEFNHKKKTVKDQKVVLYNPQGYAEREDKVDGKDRPVVAGSPSEAVYNFLWPQQAKQGKK